jgi:hypothetical protein
VSIADGWCWMILLLADASRVVVPMNSATGYAARRVGSAEKG